MTHGNRRRLATVVVAPAAALTGWAVVRLIEVDLVLKTGGTVGPVEVLVAALVGALGGWAVVRWLERTSRHPLQMWSFIGSTALALSIAGPTWRADGSSAVALIALHFVTAIVVITGFARTLPVRRQQAQRSPVRDPHVTAGREQRAVIGLRG